MVHGFVWNIWKLKINKLVSEFETKLLPHLDPALYLSFVFLLNEHWRIQYFNSLFSQRILLKKKSGLMSLPVLFVAVKFFG